MNPWLPAAAALTACIALCLLGALRGSLIDRLIAVELGGAVTVLALLVYEQGVQRQSFYELALFLAILSLPSGLLYAYFCERWL